MEYNIFHQLINFSSKFASEFACGGYDILYIMLAKELINMPNIKPISDLRNYTEMLKQVDVSNRVYLTRNSHGEYGILTMAEIMSSTVIGQLIHWFLK